LKKANQRPAQSPQAASGQEPQPGAASFLLLVAVFMTGAAALRAVFLDFGLPYIYHPDEPNNLRVIQQMLLTHSLNPHRFNYPSLYDYLNLPGQYLIRLLDGSLVPFDMESAANGFTSQPAAFIAGRVTTLVFGLAILPILLCWARTICLGFPALFVCGVMFCLSPLLLRHSTFIAPDVFSAVFVSAALFACSMIVSNGERRAYLIAAVMAGLAASSKYNAGLVAVAIAAAHVMREGFAIRRAGILAIAALTSVAAFLLASPFVALEPFNATREIVHEIHHYSSGHAGFEGHALSTNAGWIFDNVGWTGLFAAAAFLTPRRRTLVPTALFVVAYFVLISVQAVRFDRNLLPLMPPFLVLIAAGVDVLAREAGQVLPRARRTIGIAFGAAALGLFVGPATSVIEEITHYSQDPRAAARTWLNATLPPVTSRPIAIDPYSPLVERKGRTLTSVGLIGAVDPDVLSAFGYVVLSDQGSGRYLKGPYHREQANLAALRARACASYAFPPGSAQPDYTVLAFDCGR
jgi:hypothetical protein